MARESTAASTALTRAGGEAEDTLLDHVVHAQAELTPLGLLSSACEANRVQGMVYLRPLPVASDGSLTAWWQKAESYRSRIGVVSDPGGPRRTQADPGEAGEVLADSGDGY